MPESEKETQPKVTPPADLHKRLWQKLTDATSEFAKENPNLRTLDIIVVLAKMSGKTAGLCNANERDLVREMIIRNVDQGLKEMQEITAAQDAQAANAEPAATPKH